VTEGHEDDSIAAYALGALGLETAERVHAHLSNCPRCRALTLRALHAACALPFSLPLYVAPVELKSRVLHAAQAGVVDQAVTTKAATTVVPAKESAPPQEPARQPAQQYRTTVPRQVPWIAAAMGWIVAAAAIIYSHGLSDRVRVTKQSSAQAIARFKGQLSQAATLRAFLTSPDLRILPLKNWVSATSNTRVELITRARSSQEIILAQNLAQPLSGEIYVVWIKVENHRYQRVGTFTTGPHGQGLTIVNAAFPLERSSTLGISEEPIPAPDAPTTPMLLTVTLGEEAPAPKPTALPVTATAPPTVTARPTATARPTDTTVPATRAPAASPSVPVTEVPRIPGLPGSVVR
jgi:hypothetical protein